MTGTARVTPPQLSAASATDTALRLWDQTETPRQTPPEHPLGCVRWIMVDP